MFPWLLRSGSDSVSDLHYPDTVSLDVLLAGREQSNAVVLDQHGCAGDYYAGRFQIDSQRGWVAVFEGDCAIREGFDVLLLGDGGMVDSVLIIAGIWRHGFQKIPIRYDPQYWSLVFPLGMFTVATILFEKATGLAMLHLIPQITIWFAWATWVATFVGMLRSFRDKPEGD